MVHTRTLSTDAGAVSDADAQLGAVSAVLRPDGERIANADLDPWIADVGVSTLQGLYRDMAVVRRIDTEGVALQRQGQLGLWAPCRGQEAAQVGTARALRADDFAFPSYREVGVSYVRGAQSEDFVRMWRGTSHSAYNPFDINTSSPQIIIGAQTLHAVGYALGIQKDGDDQVAAAYFGDGATSQGDVSEAMVFASSFNAPVVFVCQNNQWAISEPVGVQSKFSLAARAPGFGISSMRVDGNDVLACLAAMRWAADRARTGAGPAFIEAVTYRMGPHTTADDPSRYRDDDELDRWRQRDPLARVEAHLRSIGGFDDAFEATVHEHAERAGAGLRAACLALRAGEPLTVFDHVFSGPHSGLERERAEYAAYLDSFVDAAGEGSGR